jgi:hypothetical protein
MAVVASTPQGDTSSKAHACGLQGQDNPAM